MDTTAGHSDQHRPLGGYAALMGGFGALSAAGLAAGGRAGVLPDRFRPGDLALCAVASYKLSRLVARDRITAALRAPFTRFQDDAGHGEVDEAARGRGLRRAVGELLVCPDCVGLWVASAFTAGLVARPNATRTVAAALTIHAASDVLQAADSATRRRA